MNSNSLSSLLRRAGRVGSTRANDMLGVILALSAPVLALLVGAIFSCILAAGGEAETGSGGGFARLLPNPNTFFATSTPPLSRVGILLMVALGVILMTAILLYWFYRRIQAVAVNFECELVEKLRAHAKNLARVRTLSAQQQALTDSLNYHLPRVRSSLTRWWRTFPRHLVQLLVCVLIVFLIEPLLASLTLVATGLILLVYRFLDRVGRTSLPVVRERAALQRDEIVDLSIRGPLLESVHEEEAVERRFLDQLAHYRRDAVRSLTTSSWKTPTLILIGGILLCLFVFIVAVQVIGRVSDFGVAGALTFTLCCVGAAISLVRLQRASRELRSVESAADELERFLALPVEEFDNDELEKIERVSRQAELDHVTVQDSRGRKLLENVSAVFTPGRLIGVVASQPLQAHALVELLMGFGRPVSGRMLVDDKVVTDLRPDSLAHCAHWVAPDGAIVPGSLQDNLVGSEQRATSEEMHEVLRAARLSEVLQQLPEGLSTIISPGDDRLTADAPFRIGLARAVLRKPSIVVIEESRSNSYDPQADQQTLEAMQALVGERTITVVLPQRLATLRQCDTVIVLHDHKVVGVGSHAEMLRENELYRHLNYLKFNPFRSL